MPDDRTAVTELATALGTLSYDSLSAAIDARPAELKLPSATWERLATLHGAGRFAAEFAMAYANGRAFLQASDALRGRTPHLIEWTGGRRPPGDEVAPIDLRIDHVYLISCKYLSANISNPSPGRLFDGLLATRGTWTRGDWYAQIVPEDYRTLYRECRTATGLTALPADPADLTASDRQRLRKALTGRSYPAAAQPAYRQLCEHLSVRSADRWRENVEHAGAEELLLWRLLRIGNASYFLLGADRRHALRLRIASPWDWRQTYRLLHLDIRAASAGQPRVDWSASYEDLATRDRRSVRGHVEIRWSHGRFAHPPEAKVYLDTPTDQLPGYFWLDGNASQLGLWRSAE